MCPGRYTLKAGNLARLWIDPIEGNPPLRDKFPELYGICNDQEVTVARVRRRLHPQLVKQWEEVKQMVDSWATSDEPDQVVWNLGKNKRFTTKSMYTHLESRLAGGSYSWV